jgi:hypothetical protein
MRAVQGWLVEARRFLGIFWGRPIVRTALRTGWLTALIVACAVVGKPSLAAPAAGDQTSPDAATNAANPHATAAPASGPTQSGGADWLDWNGPDFFGPCHDDCSVTVFGGRQITTAMTRIMLIHNPAPIWNWHWGDAGIIGGEFSRRLVTFWDVLNIEPEFGVAKRLGDMQAAEFWGALVFRWIAFPWNSYVKTTVAVAEGISLATQVDTVERDANRNRAGSVFLNYFSPEVTFALPKYQNYELVV